MVRRNDTIFAVTMTTPSDGGTAGKTITIFGGIDDDGDLCRRRNDVLSAQGKRR